MKANLILEFSESDIRARLPYDLIGETAARAIWGTGKKKRLYSLAFSDEEQKEVESLIRLAKAWCKNGVPQSYQTSPSIFHLWEKLGVFCLELNS